MCRAGPAIGLADQRNDDEHIAGRDYSREPAGLRVGQRPGFDELSKQRRNNRVSGDAKDWRRGSWQQLLPKVGPHEGTGQASCTI
jgi:hypothetical protein